MYPLGRRSSSAFWARRCVSVCLSVCVRVLLLLTCARVLSHQASFFYIASGLGKRYDDTLDVFGCHGIGGITGMILTGV
jgi:hypothetical protein